MNGESTALSQVLAVIGGILILLGLVGAVLLWRRTDEPMGLAIAIGAGFAGTVNGLVLLALGEIHNELRAVNSRLEELGRQQLEQPGTPPLFRRQL